MSFLIIAASPVSAQPSPTIPIAARRAGAVGLLDLSHPALRRSPGGSDDPGRSAVRRLIGERSGAWGIRVGNPAQLGALLHDLPTELHTGTLILPTAPADASSDILVDDPADTTAQMIGDWRRRGGRILVDVTSVEEAAGAEVLQPDGLVATGAEAGGRIGDENSFVLLQRLITATDLPVIAHGGIGLHSAAAAAVLGAAGVLLDAQLLLSRESPVPRPVRHRLQRLDGSETIRLQDVADRPYRLLPPPGPAGAVVDRPTEAGEPGSAEFLDRAGVGAGELLVVGQDIGLAASLAADHPTTGRIIQAVRGAVADHVGTADGSAPLAGDGPLARVHRTRYPIAQGPMTRVSDQPAFARAVAEAGGLPFLALALMPAIEVDGLLSRTAGELGDRPWGVGILGFVPDRLRTEQLAVIKRHRPPYALIAGGHPDQAQELEAAGIPTYLHVPSPGLLRLFVQAGARRFVFEGSECGGHVGPRSSFVLWDTMITELSRLPPSELADCRILFAGGIHDATSAAAAAAAAAPLVDAGAAIGVLMGTAYLSTEEIVSTGAVTAEFRQTALRCAGTALLESGPGYATRCAASPIVDAFRAERDRLRSERRGPAEISDALEQFNLGRLRIASKGLAHGSAGPVPVPIEVQHREGLFMMGQVAALRDRVCTVAELHADVATGSTARLHATAAEVANITAPVSRTGDDRIAIIGMSCLLPGAPDLQQYWANIVAGSDAITEVPPDRWNVDRYFDPDPAAADRTYSRWGGFLSDVVFDPVDYGMPPRSMPYVEGMQLLALHAVRAAITDAGYATGGLPLDSTSVIFGAGGGVSELGQRYAARSALPGLLAEVPDEVNRRLPDWTEDSFPGILVNVTAGRIANRFDFGGLNFTVDAACASSLAALHIASRELQAGTSDVVVVGGVDTMQNAFGYLAFAKTGALSARGHCRPFDESADGIAISEGVVVTVLKRLADAERDGDRIYAVLRGMGGSSDGRARGLTAPRPEGQAKALRRAYAAAGCSPATVGLIEAHGTGTVAGDRAEVETLRTIFEAAGAARQRSAIGSVKSMIGHTKCAAGLAGLVKVAEALHHRVLPPTIGVSDPNPAADFPGSPFFVNTEARPWFTADQPRRAGVSAFGFGGTNFHAVLEEYDPDADLPVPQRWPQDLFCWSGPAEGLAARIDRLLDRLGSGDPLDLAGLAAATRADAGAADPSSGRLAVVAGTPVELMSRLTAIRPHLREHRFDGPGCWWRARPEPGPIAFLYPGQGSQRAGMFREIALYAAEVRDAVQRAGEVLADVLPEPLPELMLPRPTFTPQQRAAAEAAVRATRIAQPALGAAAVGLTRLLAGFGIRPAATAGHSYGEYPALWAAGALTEDDLYRLSERRGRCIAECASEGSMLAVTGSAAEVDQILGIPPGRPAGVWLSNRNSPRQTVLSGTAGGLAQAEQRLTAAGLECRPLNVAAAFHSPLVAPAAAAFTAALDETAFGPLEIPVYANATADRYPDTDLRPVLAEHLISPVRFAEQLEAMYADLSGTGAPVFVEVGPGSVLTGLLGQTLAGRRYEACTVDGGVGGFLGALGRLWAAGTPVVVERLTELRGLTPAPVEEILATPGPLSPTAWLVNGAGARRPGRSVAAPAPVEQATPQPSAAPVPTTLPEPVKSPGTAFGRPATNGHRPAAAMPPSPASDVVQEFQRLMDQFLTTERDVMMHYLGGDPPPDTTRLADAAAAGHDQPAQPDLVADRVSGSEADRAAAPKTIPDEVERSTTPAPAAPEPVLQQLRRLLADRTGYPEELLGDDLDLEADLGIDSIKRTEVVGELLRRRSDDPGSGTAGSLRGTRTLAELAIALDARLGGGQDQPPREPAPASSARLAAPEQPAAAAVPGTDELPRLIAERRPLSPATGPDLAAGPVVIVDDGSGVAAELTRRLRDRGLRSTTMPAGLDGATPAGPISAVRGLVILSGLDRPDGADPDVTGEIQRLLRLLQDAGGQASPAEPSTPAYVLLATARGHDPGPPPHHGGTLAAAALTAFVTTLAAEWPTSRIRSVDVQPGMPASEIADLLCAELGDPTRVVEVAYRNDPASGPRRWMTGFTRGSANPHHPRRSRVDLTDAVVLVTGGGRGITARLAAGLARQGAGRLLLAGRTPLPETPGEVTAQPADPAELRRAILGRMSAGGDRPTAAAVERAAVRIERQREIAATLDRIRATGAEVGYRQLDVTDANAVAMIVEDLRRRYGRLDVVVHGAGVVADHLIGALSDEDVERVVRTKVDGALNLIAAVDPASLQKLVFITSVAGWYGNPGQAAYAAANRALDELAVRLDAGCPGRVCAMSWGPWDAPGMATAAVRRQFGQRGIGLVAPEAGVAAFLRELTDGSDDPHLLFGSGPWLLDAGVPEEQADRSMIIERAGAEVVDHRLGLVRSLR